MAATILRLNRDMIALFIGWLSVLSYEGGESGGPALGRTSDLCSSALNLFMKVCIRLSARCLHVGGVHWPVFTMGEARPLKVACSGAVPKLVSLDIFPVDLCEVYLAGSRCCSMPSSARYMHTWAHTHKHTERGVALLAAAAQKNPASSAVIRTKIEREESVPISTYSHLISGLDITLRVWPSCCDRVSPRLKTILASPPQ